MCLELTKSYLLITLCYVEGKLDRMTLAAILEPLQLTAFHLESL